jgi:hypothetical protein
MPPNQPYQPYAPPQGAMPPNPGMMPPRSAKTRPWGLIVPLVVSIVLFIAALGFGVWAFAGRADYKNNSDKKAADAVAIAVQQESTRKDKEFVEKEKNPLKKYLGPAAFGTLDISYPKTWAAFVTETDKGSTPVDGYFHPNFVPGLQSGTAFALRVAVTSQSYDQEMKQFESKVKSGKVRISAFAAKNVAGVTGSRVDGEINAGQQGTMILLPLRDRTIKLSTESQQFMNDFNTIILENLKFVP